jgi:hypothetical protein
MPDRDAIELIKQLKTRYYLAIDTCDFVGLRDVFTPNAHAVFKTPWYDVSLDGWVELEPFYRSAFTDRKFGMHQGHPVDIVVQGEVATGRWYLHDIFFDLDAKLTYQGSGLYVDRYVRKDGTWRIEDMRYDRILEVTAPLSDEMKILVHPSPHAGAVTGS